MVPPGKKQKQNSGHTSSLNNKSNNFLWVLAQAKNDG
jgi:hypothetical protein